jgi:hypothetical protein
MSEIMETLQWKPLKERRRKNRLILFYKGLNGQAKIPTTDVLQKLYIHSITCFSHLRFDDMLTPRYLMLLRNSYY